MFCPGTMALAERNESTKGKETKLMAVDSDIILIDTEKKWYERKTKAEQEADQRRRGLRGTYIQLHQSWWC